MTVLGNGSLGDMDVDLCTLELGQSDSVLLMSALRKGPSGPARLLHDVTELTRQDQLSLSGHDAGFDEHDVTPHGCVEHARRHPNGVLSPHLLGMHARLTQ